MAQIETFDARGELRILDHFPDHLAPCSTPHPAPLASFWTNGFQSELTRAGAEGSLDGVKADVVVIGTGVTGTMAADRLVEVLAEEERVAGDDGGKVKVVVLEAREFCSGATGRNGGHLTPLPRLEFAALVKKDGVEDAIRAVKLEDEAVRFVVETCKREGWTDDVDLVEGGTTHFFKGAAHEAHAKAELAAAEQAGIDNSSLVWYNTEQALEKFGASVYSAVQMPAGNLYPLKLVTKVFQRAQRKAATSNTVSISLYTNAAVERYIIHATNAYTSHLIPSLSAGPHRIVPTRGQVISAVPLPSSNPHSTSAFSSTSGAHYFFQRPDGGPIILGGARVDAGKPYEFGVTDDSRVNEKVGEGLRKYLGEEFPTVFRGEGRGVEVEREWTGIMGYTLSGDPLVGKVYDKEGNPVEGQYLSAGYSGHGMVRAPLCGRVIADIVLSDFLKKEFEIPEWLPKHFITRSNMPEPVELVANGGAGGKVEEGKGSKCTII
ncbi:FAD dependent oxidoreductase [Pseudohyphozyma bogoriensis]|nr:FAD dependent oxidoreductase [Pseudohyphozyma bogoriensis]